MVVRLSGEDLVAAVDLFEQHDARQLVGEGHGTERKPVVDTIQLEVAEWPADHEAEVAAAGTALLEELAEPGRVVLPALRSEQHDEGALGDPRGDRGVVTDLDQLEPGVTPEQLGVMGDVVDERWAQTADGDDDHSHAV